MTDLAQHQHLQAACALRTNQHPRDMFHLIHDTALLALSASDATAPHEETAKTVGEEIAAVTGLPQTQCASVVFSALASQAPTAIVAVRCANTLCQTQLV